MYHTVDWKMVKFDFYAHNVEMSQNSFCADGKSIQLCILTHSALSFLYLSLIVHWHSIFSNKMIKCMVCTVAFIVYTELFMNKNSILSDESSSLCAYMTNI